MPKILDREEFRTHQELTEYNKAKTLNKIQEKRVSNKQDKAIGYFKTATEKFDGKEPDWLVKIVEQFNTMLRK